MQVAFATKFLEVFVSVNILKQPKNDPSIASVGIDLVLVPRAETKLANALEIRLFKDKI